MGMISTGFHTHQTTIGHATICLWPRGQTCREKLTAVLGKINVTPMANWHVVPFGKAIREWQIAFTSKVETINTCSCRVFWVLFLNFLPSKFLWLDNWQVHIGFLSYKKFVLFASAWIIIFEMKKWKDKMKKVRSIIKSKATGVASDTSVSCNLGCVGTAYIAGHWPSDLWRRRQVSIPLYVCVCRPTWLLYSAAIRINPTQRWTSSSFCWWMVCVVCTRTTDQGLWCPGSRDSFE